ncbi:MAG: 4Fe-4S dicluster domain-containing protein [Thermoleophilia bacterium]
MTALANPGLARTLQETHAFDADACMNCGVCSAICPMGVDVQPRRLFRHVLLGMDDRVRDDVESIFSCLLCKMCEENCPSGVHIAENVRTLRHHLNRTVFGLMEV